jgi:hypothetical protein
LHQDQQPPYLEFVYTPTFERTAEGILTETALRALEEVLVQDPRAGKVERGLGGARKIRVRRPGLGKRGGARVVYHFSERKGRVYLLLAYAKSNQPRLTTRQRKMVSELVAELEEG